MNREPIIYAGDHDAECYFCGLHAVGDAWNYAADRFVYVCLEHMTELEAAL